MARKTIAFALAFLLLLASPVSSEKKESRTEYFDATVRISGCTGVIIRVGKEVSVGVSAQHCTDRIGTVTHFFNPDGSGGYARWVAADQEVDLAMFRVWTKDIAGSKATVMPIAENMKPPYEGWGYPKGKGPKYKGLKYEGTFHIDSLKKKRFQFRVEKGEFNNGDSGGGVYSNGKLVGITSHGSGGHKHLFSCTKSQLNKFIEKYTDKKSLRLVKWDGSDAPPLGSDKDRTVALRELIKRMEALAVANEKLSKRIHMIENTPVRVQVLHPKTGKVVAEESYPFGTPIKLVLPPSR